MDNLNRLYDFQPQARIRSAEIDAEFNQLVLRSNELLAAGNIPGPQGEQGVQGDPFLYTDFTPEQLALLVGPQGDQGDPFLYEDFTVGQLALLVGPQGEEGYTPIKGVDYFDGITPVKGVNYFDGATGAKGDKGDKGDRGDAFVYADFTQGQLDLLIGPQGEQGVQGDPFVYEDFTSEQLALLEGPQGETGPPGAAAVGGKLPSAYVELSTPQGTTSATFEDVPGMSTTITITQTVELAVMASFELQTQSGAAPSSIEVCASIDGVDHDAMGRYLSGSSDLGIGSITHRTGDFAAGTYTVKLRFRRVSGSATPGINKADMVVMAMQGAKGDTGATGSAGSAGAAGLGVPSGGAIGNVIKKKSGTDYDTEWGIDETGTHPNLTLTLLTLGKYSLSYVAGAEELRFIYTA